MKPVNELFSVEIDSDDYSYNGYVVKNEQDAVNQATRDPRPFSSTPVNLRLYTQAHIEIDGEKFIGKKKPIDGLIHLKIDRLYTAQEIANSLKNTFNEYSARFSAANDLPEIENLRKQRLTKTFNGRIAYYESLAGDERFILTHNPKEYAGRTFGYIDCPQYKKIGESDRVYNSEKQKIWPLKPIPTRKFSPKK